MVPLWIRSSAASRYDTARCLHESLAAPAPMLPTLLLDSAGNTSRAFSPSMNCLLLACLSQFPLLLDAILLHQYNKLRGGWMLCRPELMTCGVTFAYQPADYDSCFISFASPVPQ